MAKPNESVHHLNVRSYQLALCHDKNLLELLSELSITRKKKIDELREKQISDEDLKLIGIHPSLGEVTLQHLLSSWVVHDLSHISQVLRVLANQYRQFVGPYAQFLKILS